MNGFLRRHSFRGWSGSWRIAVAALVAFASVTILVPIAAANGSVTGFGRFERIAGNPAAGHQQLYEWDLFLSPATNSWVGQSRRLGAPPGQVARGDGYYRIDDVPAGTYSILVNQPDFFASPKVVPNVVISSGQTATVNVDLDVDYSTYFAQSNQWTPWEWDLYQTFRATGTSVRGIAWRLAGGGSVYQNRTAEVRILADNGNANPAAWTPIGTASRGGLAGDTDLWLRWASNDIPLQPGQNYAVHVHIDGGMAIYKRDKDAQSYALGRAFTGSGTPQNYDLNITVFVDRDGTLVTHTRKSSGPGSFNGDLSDSRWGQTFVASGGGLAAVDLFAAAASADFELQWSVREGGPTGTQIGPTKTVRSAYFASTTALAGVSFNPGEVPLVPGRTYYIEAFRPGGFVPYTQESWNAYGDGNAFRNGTSQPNLDLAMTIIQYAPVGEPPPSRTPIRGTTFGEAPLGAATWLPELGQSDELGFESIWTAQGANTTVGVRATGTTATSPTLTHRSAAATTTFDAVDLAAWRDVQLSLDVQVRNTGYESQESLRITATDGRSEVVLLSADSARLNTLATQGWLTHTVAIPDTWLRASLVIQSASNSSTGAEWYDFDNLLFAGFANPNPPASGDANADRRVDRVDLAILAQHFGMRRAATFSHGDFNADRRVSAQDAILWRNAQGGTGPSAIAVPEPAGLILAVGGAITLLARRRIGRRRAE